MKSNCVLGFLEACYRSAAASATKWWNVLRSNCFIASCIYRPPTEDRIADKPEYYDGSFNFVRAVAPTAWLAIVGAFMLCMLGAVGYLFGEPTTDSVKEFDLVFKHANDDIAARSAVLAFSGVTAAITLALSIASLVWSVSAFRGKAPAYRWPVVLWSSIFLGLLLVILVLFIRNGINFTSVLGDKLLKMAGSTFVPWLMLGLACVVPVILAAGAGFLSQPIKRQTCANLLKEQRRALARRLADLDQLLYVGALALVFGTLQLSSAMSIPLASLPKVADLKSRVDMCKTVTPVGDVSPFLSPGDIDLTACRELPSQFLQYERGDSLRQLARGVTLALGLAFSALLAAIYVPSLINLRIIVNELKPFEASIDDKVAESDIGEVDPLRRVATVVATLSPLIAGLAANVFSTG